MCIFGQKQPDAPKQIAAAPPPPEAPPMAPKIPDQASDKAKQGGRSKLRIDLNPKGKQSVGTGLQIPG